MLFNHNILYELDFHLSKLQAKRGKVSKGCLITRLINTVLRKNWFNTQQIKVAPIMKVFAPVVTTRKGIKNAPVLYGDCICDKNQFDLIRYGYADGLFRQSVSGQINNRCMDLTAVNGGQNKNGCVCVMDNADLLAKQYNTISYEILTSCAHRAERKYIY